MNYYIHQNDETKGPYTIGQMRSMWCAGLVTGDTLYCEEGYETWIHLRALVNELEKPQSLAPVQKSPVLPLPRKRRSRLKAALAVFGLAVLGIGPILFWMGSVVESNNEAIEPSAKSHTEPPLPMPPRGSNSSRATAISARVSLTYDSVRVLNLDNFDWPLTSVFIDGVVIGYSYRAASIPAGKSIIIPLREFTTRSGERFDSDKRKPKEVVVHADGFNARQFNY